MPRRLLPLFLVLFATAQAAAVALPRERPADQCPQQARALCGIDPLPLMTAARVPKRHAPPSRRHRERHMNQNAQGAGVRLLLERSGGHMPTFRPRFEVALAALAPPLRDEAGRLLAAARACPPARAVRHPDGFSYRITAWLDDGSQAVFDFADDDGHCAALDALADWIRRHKNGNT